MTKTEVFASGVEVKEKEESKKVKPLGSKDARIDTIRRRIDQFIRKETEGYLMEHKERANRKDENIAVSDYPRIFYLNTYRTLLDELADCFKFFNSNAERIDSMRSCIDDRVEQRVSLAEEREKLEDVSDIRNLVEQEMMLLDKLNILDQEKINDLMKKNTPLSFEYEDLIVKSSSVIDHMIDRGLLFLESFKNNPYIDWTYSEEETQEDEIDR